MNVTVEHLAPCKKLLRVDVESQAVDATLEEITKDFMKHARLPGFRPGKAPRHLVIKSFSPQIDEETRRKLISENYRKAVTENQLRVVGTPDFEEIQFSKGQPFQFVVTVETAPDFELPDYKGLPVKKPLASVTEQDIERALSVLTEQRALYQDVEREVRDGDYVVVNYTGTCEGRPLTDIAPAARGLTEKKDFWLHVGKDSFIPGFTEQLLGAKAGDKRSVGVKFPSDFVAKPLSGRDGLYEVEITQVKEKILPELNDELAKSFGADSLMKLREGVAEDLRKELDYKIRRTVREQLIQSLLARVTCDLPESVVQNETRNVVYDIVRENQERGITRDMIDQQKDQIFSYASNNAKDRVKLAFILAKIAEKEGVTAESEEMSRRVLLLAAQQQIKPEQIVKQLRETNGFGEIQEQVINAKVFELLEQHAMVEEVLPGAGITDPWTRTQEAPG